MKSAKSESFKEGQMVTYINRYGDRITKWISHASPKHPNCTAPVYWTARETPDGNTTVCYGFPPVDFTAPVVLRGYTKEQAIAEFK